MSPSYQLSTMHTYSVDAIIPCNWVVLPLQQELLHGHFKREHMDNPHA